MKPERADLRVKRNPGHGYDWGIWLDYDSPDSMYSGHADDEDAAVEAGRECARRRGLDVEPPDPMAQFGRAVARIVTERVRMTAGEVGTLVLRAARELGVLP